jgi:hypothetical protein
MVPASSFLPKNINAIEQHLLTCDEVFITGDVRYTWTDLSACSLAPLAVSIAASAHASLSSRCGRRGKTGELHRLGEWLMDRIYACNETIDTPAITGEIWWNHGKRGGVHDRPAHEAKLRWTQYRCPRRLGKGIYPRRRRREHGFHQPWRLCLHIGVMWRERRS